jgi:hypothetical protein
MKVAAIVAVGLANTILLWSAGEAVRAVGFGIVGTRIVVTEYRSLASRDPGLADHVLGWILAMQAACLPLYKSGELLAHELARSERAGAP